MALSIQDKKKICVTTDTFYGKFGKSGPDCLMDNVRGLLAIQMLQKAKDQGFPIVIIDGGSSLPFLQQLSDSQISFSDQKENGMSAGRQQGYVEAFANPNVDIIARTESEKVSFIGENGIEHASMPILSGSADIVLPSRIGLLSQHYPPKQAASEDLANAMYNDTLRRWGVIKDDQEDFDWFFGVRLFNRKAYPHFMRRYHYQRGNQHDAFKHVAPHKYSNALFFPVVSALMEGLRVVSVPVSYVHPAEQTKAETGDAKMDMKRIDQRWGILTELEEFLRYKHGEVTRLYELS